MIAFFDTNVYIGFLKGTFPKPLYHRYFEDFIIRVCPVVYQELIRGVRGEKLKKQLETLLGSVCKACSKAKRRIFERDKPDEPKTVRRSSSYVERFLVKAGAGAAEKPTLQPNRLCKQTLSRVIFLPPPTTDMWIKAGELAGVVMQGSEERRWEKIQNDLLIALTARHNGATFITSDLHFKLIQRYIPFRLLFHESQSIKS